MGQREDNELKRAILAYDLVTAEAALRAGANPNLTIGETRARTPHHTSSFVALDYLALHLAARDDDVELAALLLLHGARPNPRIYQGVLPISIAAQHNHVATAELLLFEYERPTGHFAYCPACFAARHGHASLVLSFLEKKPDAFDLNEVLRSAVAHKENLILAEQLVALGARAEHLHPTPPGHEGPPTTTRMQALTSLPAALPLFVGHRQVRLLDAAMDGDTSAIAGRLQAGESPDDSDLHGYTTALSAASRCGHTAVVQQLLEAGASLRGPRKKADPLRQALRGGHLETAAFLWSAGARTPRMVRELVRYDFPLESVVWAIDHDRKVDLGEVLYDAARVSKLEIARLVLARGARTTFANHGRTALMIATSRRSLEMVELLVEHGADLHAKDARGFGVMDYAVRIGDPDDPDDPWDFDERLLDYPIVHLLKRHGLGLSDH